MAQLKDLIVSGASRLISKMDCFKISISTLKAPSESSYTAGSANQILKSDGTKIKWANVK